MSTTNLTKTSVERFKLFMKFIADNNLWDEVEQHLKSQGCTEIHVSGEPIAAIRQLLQQKLTGSPHMTATEGSQLAPQAAHRPSTSSSADAV